MNKEDILDRSRKERKDEGMEQAISTSRNHGFIIMSILLCVVGILDLLYAKDIRAFEAVSAIFWGFWSLEHFSKYRFNKKGIELLNAVVACLGSILCFLLYLKYTFR